MPTLSKPRSASEVGLPSTVRLRSVMASMVARMAESLTSPWKQFQERQPMGGVSASPGTGGAAAPVSARLGAAAAAAAVRASEAGAVAQRGSVSQREAARQQR